MNNPPLLLHLSFRPWTTGGTPTLVSLPQTWQFSLGGMMPQALDDAKARRHQSSPTPWAVPLLTAPQSLRDTGGWGRS